MGDIWALIPYERGTYNTHTHTHTHIHTAFAYYTQTYIFAQIVVCRTVNNTWQFVTTQSRTISIHHRHHLRIVDTRSTDTRSHTHTRAHAHTDIRHTECVPVRYRDYTSDRCVCVRARALARVDGFRREGRAEVTIMLVTCMRFHYARLHSSDSLLRP